MRTFIGVVGEDLVTSLGAVDQAELMVIDMIPNEAEDTSSHSIRSLSPRLALHKLSVDQLGHGTVGDFEQFLGRMSRLDRRGHGR